MKQILRTSIGALLALVIFIGGWEVYQIGKAEYQRRERVNTALENCGTMTRWTEHDAEILCPQGTEKDQAPCLIIAGMCRLLGEVEGRQ